jgi:hypothetical protein
MTVKTDTVSDVIGAGWREFRREMIPRNTPRGQIQANRRAFYGGAMAMLLGILTKKVERAGMDAIQAELEQFAHNVLEGRA